jgi:hypothetical protein
MQLEFRHVTYKLTLHKERPRIEITDIVLELIGMQKKSMPLKELVDVLVS